MTTLADIVLDPGRIAGWLVVGLIAGWLASKMMEPASYELIGEIILGALGAVIGAVVFGWLRASDPGFWASIGVAFIGACLLIAGGRAITALRSA
jgi:uncharacterized membrane protein YeaQ/YmgE (transglycosylase-associated protein family)